MLNIVKLHFSQNRSLLIATLLSLLLHALFLNKFTLTLPELDEDHQSLEMRLVNLPPKHAAAPVPIKKEAPISEPKRKPAPEQKPKPKIDQIDPDEVHTPDLNKISPDAVAPAQQAPNQVETPQDTSTTANTVTEIPSAEIPEPADTIVPVITTEQPRGKAYKYVETEFEVRRSSDTNAAGTARIVFNIKVDNTYRLTSITEAKGLASLFFGKLQQVSEGTVTENGLVPHYYLYQYGSDEKKAQHADFLWSDNTLEMFSAKGKKTEVLTPGVQDFLSFMYQFMFIPPLASNQIIMTNGKNLRTYIYSFQGEETIQTKFEELNTIHLLKQGDEEEKTELWLAIDYQNLPVKIRKTEKNGSFIEQTATKIETIRP